MKGRRAFLTAGLGLAGLSVLGYGGSLVGCRMAGVETALLKPLMIGLRNMRMPDRVGRAWLAEESAETAAAALRARRDLMHAALKVDDTDRMRVLAVAIRDEFSRGDVVVADRFVVSRTEARLAALWLTI